MQTTAISDIIGNFDILSVDDKEYTVGIIKKNLIETKRNELIKRVAEAKENYSKGKVKQGNLEDLFEDLGSHYEFPTVGDANGKTMQ